MQLYIEEYTEPPSRSDLSKSTDVLSNVWTPYIEAISSWFCTSHSIRKERSVLVKIDEILIYFEGKNIRYLDPSYRSIGSLLANAYVAAKTKSRLLYQESSPGIFYKQVSSETIQVDYLITLDSKGEGFPTLHDSSIISFNSQNHSFKLPTLASNYSQAVVWINHQLQLVNK